VGSEEMDWTNTVRGPIYWSQVMISKLYCKVVRYCCAVTVFIWLSRPLGGKLGAGPHEVAKHSRSQAYFNAVYPFFKAMSVAAIG